MCYSQQVLGGLTNPGKPRHLWRNEVIVKALVEKGAAIDFKDDCGISGTFARNLDNWYIDTQNEKDEKIVAPSKYRKLLCYVVLGYPQPIVSVREPLCRGNNEGFGTEFIG